MTKPNDCYSKLLETYKQIAILNSCTSVLSWDRETYLPESGTRHRADQLSLLCGMSHEKAISPEINDWLAECQDSDLTNDPHSITGTNIREWRRNYDKKIKIPGTLVEEMAHTISMGHKSWIEARSKSEFNIFLPWLKKIIHLKQQYAELIADGRSIYDTLLDDYEPGESSENIRAVFSALKTELVPIIDNITSARHQPDLNIISNNFDIAKQNEFGQLAAETVGFNFNAGRLDTVVHPFCTGLGPNDTRITTRWDPHNVTSAFFGIMHETGHGIYNQNLPSEHWGTPAGSSISLGIHESQSRMWENLVARNKPFWSFFYPKLQHLFPNQLSTIPIEHFLHSVNHVQKSFIRVDADEVTYTLHIILRFEIEQALITGDLPPEDLPEVWNKSFSDLFGLEVSDDANGCLQDVHWSYGSFGYFPTYALGNLYAAQFFHTARKDITDLDEQFALGNFSQLFNWLNENIHSLGMRYNAPELVQKITGEPLNHRYLIESLQRKFYPLYNI